jgi:hypothetical protein
MAPMRMSWRAVGGHVASKWVESKTPESYHPAWLQSLYPYGDFARRSSLDQPPLSPFGKTRYHLKTS